MAEARRRDPPPGERAVKRTSARRVLTLAFVAALGGALACVVAAVALAKGETEGWWALAIVGGASCLIGGWIGHETVKEHFQALERLRGFAVAMRAAQGVAASAPPAGDRESAALRDAIVALIAAREMSRDSDARRLSAILAALPDAVIAVTERGQVSLINGPAMRLFGVERAAVGTSLFDAVTQASLSEAWSRARRERRPARAELDLVGGARVPATVADLGEHGGALIVLAADRDSGAALAHDLSLHELPPDAPTPDDATPLERLPVAALDTETTGLVPSHDRIVAIGGVRLYGATIYRAAALDRLARPDVPVPARASAIHGLTDAMLADAPPFAALVEDLLRLIEKAVPLGHNIGFDLTIIAAECRRAGIEWTPPSHSLCTLRLAAALDPEEEALDLEAVAARYGLDPLGRHSALGDSLLTAALWQRMLPRLQECGIATLGEAVAFAASAKRVVTSQKTAGW